VIDKKFELLEAVQAHAEGAVTVTVPVPPVLLSEVEFADSEYVQETPLSVTVNAWPAMVSVPVWPVSPEFGEA
jgi:hypothetical protein